MHQSKWCASEQVVCIKASGVQDRRACKEVYQDYLNQRKCKKNLSLECHNFCALVLKQTVRSLLTANSERKPLSIQRTEVFKGKDYARSPQPPILIYATAMAMIDQCHGLSNTEIIARGTQRSHIIV
jgi:hypothetical protein